MFTQALHDATRRCVVPWTGWRRCRALNRRDEALQGLLAHAKSVTSRCRPNAPNRSTSWSDGLQLFAALDARRADQVATRFIQLTPVYTSLRAVLPDGSIWITAVPWNGTR